MQRMVRLGVIVAGLLLAAVPARAQGGFALKGGLVFNSSDVDRSVENVELEDAAGFHLGAEYVLPIGLGVGLSGYTAGSPDDFSVSEGTFVLLAEANYFLRLPMIPLTPYAGIHTGLGTVDLGDTDDFERPDVDLDDRGWQVGVRFQPLSFLGLDAQYRRVSGSLQSDQDLRFDSDQILIGVTLF